MSFTPYNFLQGETLRAAKLNKMQNDIKDEFENIRGQLNGEAVKNSKFDIEEILFTEFEKLPGWWTNTEGTMIENSSGKERWHSQLIPINPETNYYLGYTHNALAGTDYEWTGAFFDEYGEWLGALRTEDVKEYSYNWPNAYPDLEETATTPQTPPAAIKDGEYVKLYKFTSPENAAFFSYNLAIGSDKNYRQFVSSKPIFVSSNSGNYIIRKGEPFYQEKKNKKLCIIGPSGAALHGLHRYSYEVNGVPQFLIGYQGYLGFWYDKVDTYGFWGGGWGWADADSNLDLQETLSIYKGVMGEYTNEGPIDFTEYDEFLLMPSSNGNDRTGIGEIDDRAPKEDGTITYFCGLNRIIDLIYDQRRTWNGAHTSYTWNENYSIPKIYIANVVHKAGTGKSAPEEYFGTNLDGSLKLPISSESTENPDVVTEPILLYHPFNYSYNNQILFPESLDDTADLNHKLELFSFNYGYDYIDLLREMGVNKETYRPLTIDDNKHFNNLGNKMLGMVLRKKLIGI